MSTPMLVIGNKNYSSWSLRAWLALTYGIVLGAAANHYKDTVLSDPNMQQWFSDSVNEKEVIEIAELG